MASASVTIGDLVRKSLIPRAALSPDGRFTAYVVIRGDPERNDYEVNVRLFDLRKAHSPISIASYRLRPDEAFDEAENLLASAAGIRWISPNELLYLVRSDEGAGIRILDVRRRANHELLGHAVRLQFVESSCVTNAVEIEGDELSRPVSPLAGSVRDMALRVIDDDKFHGPLKNPNSDPLVTHRRWLIELDRPQGIMLADAANAVPSLNSRYERTSGCLSSSSRPSEATSNSFVYLRDQKVSPDGSHVAAVEEGAFDIDRPGQSYSSSRLIVLQAGNKVELLAYRRPRSLLSILGWRTDNRAVYFLEVRAEETIVGAVTLDGHVDVLRRETSELAVPCANEGDHCQAMSVDGHNALLVRSKSNDPAALIAVDLRAGTTTVLDSPNRALNQSEPPDVRFYEIDEGGPDAFGHLYLPANRRPGSRYPLVITQYVSRRGFYASVGDEVPILPLLNDGIAVFAMHSRELNQTSTDGDFEMEINRVRRPVRAMEWIYNKLVAEGIVDPDKCGLTGLSYGSEIAMYAYWNTRIFRAISSASASWDPALMSFNGLSYAASLERRGFPVSEDERALGLWRSLAAGLNARSELPPLLLQSADAEENLTVPTWFRLRRVGAPVEWYEYPGEGHVKRSPANKWWVFSRNRDWFRFWLQGKEDEVPEKQEQYLRWREWRKHLPTDKAAVSAAAD